MTAYEAPCVVCGAPWPTLLICADLGEGAFLKVLCDTCWHRAQYRAALIGRLPYEKRIKRRVFGRIAASRGSNPA